MTEVFDNCNFCVPALIKDYRKKPLFQTVSDDYSAAADELVLVDASVKAIAILLPAAQLDCQIIVKKIDSSANIVTIAPSEGGETIDLLSSIMLTEPGQDALLLSDGSNWVTIGWPVFVQKQY